MEDGQVVLLESVVASGGAGDDLSNRWGGSEGRFDDEMCERREGGEGDDGRVLKRGKDDSQQERQDEKGKTRTYEIGEEEMSDPTASQIERDECRSERANVGDESGLDDQI